MRVWQKAILTGVCCVFVGMVVAAQSAEYDYAGTKKCKICHKDEYEIWEKKKHAKAWDTLSAEEKKNEKCIGCHTTNGPEMPDVTCEACHGPGSEYSSPMIMNKAKYKANPEQQHKKAIEAGLQFPTKETCVKCHNEKSPTFKGFDYEKQKAQIKHWD